MTQFARYTVEDRIGVIEIDNPPVNALGIGVRRAIAEGMEQFAKDESVEAIVLLGGGRVFSGGADITEFGHATESPDLLEVIADIESNAKPVIAAIHGVALGGGLELALAGHYRIAVPSARVGLPEVNLGLLPGAGGTQRLPRIVGVPAALEMIGGGNPVSGTKALELGLVDALAQEGRLREDAIAFARRVVAERKPLARVRDRNEQLEAAKADPGVFEAYLTKNARAFRGFRAPTNIVAAVQAAVDTAPDFEAGMKREGELFQELHDSIESEAQRYYFFAERETAKVPEIGKDVSTVSVAKVGVIGAGTMGGGITMNFLNVGLPVTLVEMNQEALDRGLGVIRRNYENSAKKGRMTQDEVERRMALITPAIGLDALAEVDLVIEAVFEQMSIKKDIFGKLDAIAKPGAILASNTSFLDLNEIAAATSRPEWVVGMHFFSPANVMRLLEVVRGAKTSKEVVKTAMELGKKIGKVPVLSGVCDGFIANRIMKVRGDQADEVILQGPTPQEVDEAIFDYGFAMGPFQMLDLIGLDVIGRDRNERSVMGDLVQLDRLGQKKNGGYYDYDEQRRATPSPVAAEVIADFARSKGIVSKGGFSAEQIVARLLYPVVNEGAKVLEEGIALRASDIDVAAVLGYNWPVYTGGPMFWGDTVGLQTVVDGLRAQGIEPCALLIEKAASGGSFTR